MRGATKAFTQIYDNFRISIHAPRERSDALFLKVGEKPKISIHAPRERSDIFGKKGIDLTNFISIHAPRERSDVFSLIVIILYLTFQSTLLVRGATVNDVKKGSEKIFQSTLLVRGATQPTLWYFYGKSISIHAPRERSDGW